MTLIEIALLGAAHKHLSMGMNDLFDQLDSNPMFRLIPVTTEIAREASGLAGSLRDPGDCVIVATARVHRLSLLTSDQRIVDSNLVPVVD